MSTYYIDLDTGNDGNDGLSIGQAWLTPHQFTSGLPATAGDIAIMRRGTSITLASDVNFSNDGTLTNYISLIGDNGQAWTADETQLGGGSNTSVTAGSETVTVVGEDVTGTISAGDGWKLDGDVRAYEVRSVSFSTDTTITLWLPYRGATQTGINSNRVPPLPKIIGTTSYNLFLSTDDLWRFKDFHLDSGGVSSQGQFYCNNNRQIIMDGLVWTNGTLGRGTVRALSQGQTINFYRCRMYESDAVYHKGGQLNFYDCYFKESVDIIQKDTGTINSNIHLEDIIFDSASPPQIELSSGRNKITGRNLVNFPGFDGYQGNSSFKSEMDIEDYGGTLEDNRRFSNLDQTDGVATIQSDTGTVRGDATTSIKCIGSDFMNTNTDNNRILLNEWFITATTDSKTYSVYFNLPASEFTAAPTASELYLEAFALTATGAERIKTLSTGTILADGNWNNIDITVAPGQAGILYLRAYYAKVKEGGKTNVFYTDPVVDIA